MASSVPPTKPITVAGKDSKMVIQAPSKNWGQLDSTLAKSNA